MTDHFPPPWRVCPYALHIYADNVPKGPARVADLRGWGYLTGKGHGALGLSDDEGIKVQKANAELIVKAVNSHGPLVKALTDALCELSHCADQLGAREHNSVRRAIAESRRVLAAVGGVKQP
ncbi:MAG: hypothetical protein JWP25_4650 [Bradyrhizobium sp.]|nr:hypothetical protein [Bradyrhizobium sp.]